MGFLGQFSNIFAWLKMAPAWTNFWWFNIIDPIVRTSEIPLLAFGICILSLVILHSKQGWTPIRKVEKQKCVFEVGQPIFISFSRNIHLCVGPWLQIMPLRSAPQELVHIRCPAPSFFHVKSVRKFVFYRDLRLPVCFIWLTKFHKTKHILYSSSVHIKMISETKETDAKNWQI